ISFAASVERELATAESAAEFFGECVRRAFAAPSHAASALERLEQLRSASKALGPLAAARAPGTNTRRSSTHLLPPLDLSNEPHIDPAPAERSS
ncbi:MAG: hypothetical protein AAGB34_11870, partial [Planctomycetota bacterium]